MMEKFIFRKIVQLSTANYVKTTDRTFETINLLFVYPVFNENSERQISIEYEAKTLWVCTKSL